MLRVEVMPVYFQWMTQINYIRFSLVSSLLNSYGFGRCEDEFVATNQTDFLELIPPEKLLEIYGSDRINSDHLISAMKVIVNGIGSDPRSVVLTQFNLQDSDYYYSIVMLFFHYFLYRGITYFVIKSKIKLLS